LQGEAEAARKLNELGIGAGRMKITRINEDAYRSICVRNDETDLTPLRDAIDSIDVRLVEEEGRRD
jgi:hypothetical protein